MITSTISNVAAEMNRYHDEGLSVLPINPRTKRPTGEWKEFQTAPATEEQLAAWGDVQAFALICGRVSGGVMILDFDEPRFYDRWREEVADLADGLPVQRTGGGGYQLGLRCPEPGTNTKLAFAPDATQEDGRHVAIETRGEGGYAVMPPSLHPSGNRYQLISGDFAEIPVVTQARVNALLIAARKLCEAPLSKRMAQQAQASKRKSDAHRHDMNGQASVIDEFNKRMKIDDILLKNGYTRVGDRMLRPGAEATSEPGVVFFDREGDNLRVSYHWSSNDPLNDGHAHDAFSVFAEFDFRGDAKEAVKAAAELLGMAREHASRNGDGRRHADSNRNGHEDRDRREGNHYQPILTSYADIAPEDIRWTWPRHFPSARISLLAGRQGIGKTFVTADFVARITTGTPWPDGAPCARGSVIIANAEDGRGDTIRKRLDAHGADVSRVFDLSGIRRIDDDGRAHVLPFSLAHVAALEQVLHQHPDTALVLIDPIGSFIGGQVDAHRDNEVRAVLGPVADLAVKYGPAVLLVAHIRKAISTAADDGVLGSRGFTGIARSVWHLMYDENDTGRRLMLPGKCNLCAQPDGLAFTIGGDPAVIVWEAEGVKMNADDAMSDATPGPEPEARGAAESWLDDILASGPVPSGDVNRPDPESIRGMAKAAGLSWRTIRRAADKLGVIAERCPYRKVWTWRLPKSTCPTNLSTVDNKGNMDNLDH